MVVRLPLNRKLVHEYKSGMMGAHSGRCLNEVQNMVREQGLHKGVIESL